MTPIPFALDRASVDALGWALVHFLWQGAAVLVLLSLAHFVLARASAQARYVAGCVALALMLALPVATFVTIRSHAPKPERFSIPKVGRDVPPVSSLDRLWASSRPDLPLTLRDKPLTIANVLADVQQRAGSFYSTGIEIPFPRALFWVVLAWIAGVALFTLRLVGGWWLVRRLARSAANAPLDAWQERLGELARAIGVSRPVRLCRSALVAVPATIGMLKPVILLPASALTGLGPDQIEAILAHELAHIRRHDYFVNLLQNVIETLLFYHPAVWWVSRRVREERELCCDDLAVRVCGDPVAYARALCEMESLRGPGAAFALAASGGSLFERIARLLKPAAARRHARPYGPAGALGIAGIIGLLALSSLDVRAGSGAASASTGAFNVRTVTRTERVTATVTELAERIARVTETPLAVAPALAALDEAAAVSTKGHACATASARCAAKARADAKAAAIAQGAAACQESAEAAELARVAAALEAVESGDVASCNATAGIELPEADRKALARSGIGPDYLAALAAAGYRSLPPAEIRRVSEHVSADCLRALHEAGLDPPSVDDLIQLADHGVSAKLLGQLPALGGGKTGVANLIRLADSGVSAEWLSAMRWLGYSDLTTDQAIQLANNGVTPEYVSQLRVMTHERPSSDELLRLVQEGITPQFVVELRAFVRPDFTIDELVRMHQQGVTPEFVEKLKAVGYGNLVVEDLIRLEQQGVGAEYVAEMTTSLGHPILLEDLIRLKQSGAGAELVTRMRKAGIHDPGVEDVIRAAQQGLP